MRIRYYGHMGELTGYGKAAEHYIAALRAAGADVEAHNPSRNSTYLVDTVGRPDEVWSNEIDAVVIHAPPLSCEAIYDTLTFYEKNRTVPVIAYTTWEALTVDHDISINLQGWFHEVWVPSEASAKPFRDQPDPGEEPNVFVIPHCFPEDEIMKTVRFSTMRGGAPFRFYWVGAWNARKNPSGLIRAFVHAFRPNYPGYEGDVELYLHSHGTPIEALIAELAATGIPQDELPRIRMNNEHLTDDQMRELHARGDCFVTAARGEAWNMPCFEALLHGNLIITTENLGSDDYLIDTDAQRVNARRAPAWNTLSRMASANGQVDTVPVGAQGLTSRDLWLEPDLEQFATKMRRVYESSVRKTTINYSLTERYSYAPVAQMILNRLEALR